MADFEPSDRCGSRSQRTSWLFAALALGSVLSASPALAQGRPQAGAGPAIDLCQVFAVDRTTGGLQDLQATCRGRGVMLGPVSSFEVIGNEALGATLVDVRRGSERRVLLLSIQPDGTPLVEDLTGQIALAAGRGPMSEIDGVEVDLKAFVRTGEIGVKGGPRDNGPHNGGKISLGPQIAAERSRRGSGAQN